MDRAAAAVAHGAQDVDFALFELFLTDKAGHAQNTFWGRHEVQRTERFLSAVVRHLSPTADTVVVVSDHGNLEDLSTRGHTLASVPALAWGRGADSLIDGWNNLADAGQGVFDRVVASQSPMSFAT
jgi:2,3-bisphosphoglycerate-independent phosphoglycerate mutase